MPNSTNRACADRVGEKGESPERFRVLIVSAKAHSFTSLMALSFTFLSISAVAQSGWTRRKNTYFAKIAYNYFQSSDYYNPSGEKLVTSLFRQQSIAFYGEYGFTDRFTAIVHAPLFKGNGYETTNTVYGIGDLKLEFKYRLLKKIPLAISVAPEFPTGSRNNYAINKKNPQESINLPTGDGEFNLWTTLSGSASFHPVQAYVSLSAAFNYRTRYEDINFRNQLKYSAEAGYKIADLVWINATLTAQQSLGEQSGTTDFVRGDGTEFTALSLGAAYEFTSHWSLTAQAWSYSDLIFSRKNIYSAPTYSIGIFYEIK